jgi:hypothetical protein
MNMEFSKVYIVDFKDVRNPIDTKKSFAEIVLIDRTHPAVQPLLYQLNHETILPEDLPGLRDGLVSMARDSFKEVGPVLSIDRKNKQILLENQCVMTYKYLIIASGAHQTMTGGLQTLFDALKFKTLPAFEVFEKDGVLVQNLKLPVVTIDHSATSEIEKIVGRKLLNAMMKAQPTELSPNNKIYEVQL